MVEEKDQEKANADQVFEASRKKNLINAFYTGKPVYNVLNIYGVFIFRVADGELKPPNWKMKVYGVVCIVVYAVLYFGTFKLPFGDNGKNAFVDSINQITGLILLIQFVSSAITTCFLANTTNVSVMEAFSELDTILRVENINNFYKKSHTLSIKLLIGVSITHAINSLADIITADDVETNYNAIIDLPLHFYQKLQVLAFIILILMLRSRLMLINNYLTTFIKEQSSHRASIFTIRDTKITTASKFNFIGHPSDSNLKIRDLAIMYDLIGKLCLMINDVFNYQIFMTLVSTFVFIVTTIWTALYYYRNAEGNSGPLINITIWCFSSIYTVACMSFICERLLLTRNETKILVNKVIMNYDLPKIMRVQAKAFMELIEAWPLRIYIYDMFSVDITLMLKFISVATTYLIVIIQISHFI